MDTKKFILRLLYCSIGLAGLIAAILILVSPSGDVAFNGVITALLILLTDAFILLGLVSRYEWLKITTWITSLYSLIVTVILVWMPNKYEVMEYSGRNYGGRNDVVRSGSSDAYEMMQNLSAGAYIILTVLAFVCVFTLFSKIQAIEEKVSKISYISAIALGIASGFILGASVSWDTEGFVLRLGFSLMFLAFTAAFIMLVALIFAANKRNKAKREEFMAQQGNNVRFSNNPQDFVQGVQGSGKTPYPGSYPGYGSTAQMNNTPPVQQQNNGFNNQQVNNDPNNVKNDSNIPPKPVYPTNAHNGSSSGENAPTGEYNGQPIPPKPDYPPTVHENNNNVNPENNPNNDQ